MSEEKEVKPSIIIVFEGEGSVNCKVETNHLDPLQLAAAVRLLDEICSVSLRNKILFDKSKTHAHIVVPNLVRKV